MTFTQTLYYVLAMSIVFMSDNIRKKLLCKTRGKKRDIATNLSLRTRNIKMLGKKSNRLEISAKTMKTRHLIEYGANIDPIYLCLKKQDF